MVPSNWWPWPWRPGPTRDVAMRHRGQEAGLDLGRHRPRPAARGGSADPSGKLLHQRAGLDQINQVHLLGRQGQWRNAERWRGAWFDRLSTWFSQSVQSGRSVIWWGPARQAWRFGIWPGFFLRASLTACWAGFMRSSARRWPSFWLISMDLLPSCSPSRRAWGLPGGSHRCGFPPVHVEPHVPLVRTRKKPSPCRRMLIEAPQLAGSRPHDALGRLRCRRRQRHAGVFVDGCVFFHGLEGLERGSGVGFRRASAGASRPVRAVWASTRPGRGPSGVDAMRAFMGCLRYGCQCPGP